MKNILLYLLAMLMSAGLAFGQDSTRVKKDKRPARAAFESGMVINNQTGVIPTVSTLEFMIQHRFGVIQSGTFDMLGMYAPSNIRLELAYTPHERVQIGFGSTKNHKYFDGNIKVGLLQQTRSNSMPVSLAYYGIINYTAKQSELYIKTSHRFSYFSELIITRRFTPRISVQLAPSFSHHNIVDSLVPHDVLGLSVAGRYKFSPQMSILFEYDYQFNTPDEEFKKFEVKPNLGLGIEVATTAHSFQIFVSSFDALVNQHNFAYNTSDYSQGFKGLHLGFNINRLWNF